MVHRPLAAALLMAAACLAAPTAEATVFAKGATGEAAAVGACRAAAVTGDAEAQHQLGRRYARGLGLAKDPRRARVWLELAARSLPSARYELAELLASGALGKPDLPGAYIWHALAAPAAEVPTAAHKALAPRMPRAVLVQTQLRLAAHFAASEQNGKGHTAYDASGKPQLGTRASRWLLAAAEGGSAEAQLQVADGYRLGRGGFPRDPAGAGRWYLKAAEAGHKPAQRELGKFWLERGQTESGQAWLTRAAKAGDPDAMMALGHMHAHGGQGRLRNYPESLRWYTLAAAQPGPHHHEACFALGELYDTGKGTAEDLSAAKRWFEQGCRVPANPSPATLAAAYGRVASHYMVKRDGDRMVRWMRLQGAHSPRLSDLAHHFLNGFTIDGRELVAQNVAEGLKVLRDGAERGDGICSLNLAFKYQDGRVIAKDPAEARKWFTAAAKADMSGAFEYLGLMLIRGEGGPKNVPEGLAWLERAVAANDTRVAVILGGLYERGEHLPQDPGRAKALYEKAALRGHRPGMGALARLHETRAGDLQDAMTAYAWYFAVSAVDRRAHEGYSRLHKRLSPEEREAALLKLEPLFAAQPSLRPIVRDFRP